MEKEYVCKKTCFFQDRLWKPGEILVSSSAERPNKHFILARRARVVKEVIGDEAESYFDLQQKEAEALKRNPKLKPSGLTVEEIEEETPQVEAPVKTVEEVEAPKEAKPVEVETKAPQTIDPETMDPEDIQEPETPEDTTESNDSEDKIFE